MHALELSDFAFLMRIEIQLHEMLARFTWTWNVLLKITCLLQCRADSRFAPSQWETSLQSNAVSHWLGTNPESALAMPDDEGQAWVRFLSSAEQDLSQSEKMSDMFCILLLAISLLPCWAIDRKGTQPPEHRIVFRWAGSVTTEKERKRHGFRSPISMASWDTCINQIQPWASCCEGSTLLCQCDLTTVLFDIVSPGCNLP